MELKAKNAELLTNVADLKAKVAELEADKRQSAA